MVYVHVRTRPHAAESMCARKAWAAGGTRQPAGGRRARLRRRAACCALSDGRRKQTKLIGAVAPLARPLLPGRAPCEAAQLAAFRPPTPLPSALAALAPPPRTAPPRGAPPAPCGPCGPAAAASAAGDNNWVEASGFRRRQRPGTHVHLVPANFTSHQVSVANLSGCEGGGARRVHTMLQPGRFCRRTPPPSRYRSAHMTPPALGPPSPPPMSRKCKPSCNSKHGEQNPVLMKAPEHCPL